MGSAIKHALAAGDTERAADLVDVAAEGAAMRGEVMTLLQWVEGLPKAAVAARPHLALMYAWSLLVGGAPAEEVQAWLQVVEARDEMAAATGAIRGYVKLFEGDLAAASTYAEQAQRALPERAVFLRQLAALVLGMAARYGHGEDDPERALADASKASTATENIFVAVLGLCARADMASRRGDLSQAEANYERALKVARDEDGRLLPVASEPLLGLAALALELSELAQAEQMIEEGIALAQQWSGLAAIDGHLLRSRIHRLRGEHRAMRAQLEKAETVAGRFDATEMDDIIVALFRTQAELHLGDRTLARRWLEERDVHAESATRELNTHPSPVRKYEYLLLARLFLAEADPEKALSLLDTLRPHFARHRARITIHLLRAVAREQMDQHEIALASLVEALSLGKAAGMVTVFVEEGEPVARLLYRGLQEEELSGFSTYVRQLLASFPALLHEEPPAGWPMELVEPLSDREVEVLSLVAEGLTNQEIADRLFLSVATIKWHTSNIYGKLAVSNRTESVAKARALGLLSRSP